MTQTPDSLMDIQAVAVRLGVQVRHVRRLVHERRIPYLKWGHLLRFDPAEIERWLDEARRPSPPINTGTAPRRLRTLPRGSQSIPSNPVATLGQAGSPSSPVRLGRR
jgi:excisionase family DNA binding protein